MTKANPVKISAAPDEVTLIIPLADLRVFQKATNNAPYLCGSTASVFNMLWSATASGFVPDESGLLGLYERCKRGLEAAAEKEGETLHRLDGVFRRALAEFPENEAKA